MYRKGMQSRENTQECENLKILEIKSWGDVKSDRLLFKICTIACGGCQKHRPLKAGDNICGIKTCGLCWVKAEQIL